MLSESTTTRLRQPDSSERNIWGTGHTTADEEMEKIVLVGEIDGNQDTL
jgi:hypothetical protein